MNKGLRVTFISVVCVAVIVGIFYSFTANRSNKNVENEIELTEVQQLITRDLSLKYPETPREVVKLYSRIIDCFYGNQLSEDEFYQLGDMARELFDEDLLQENPRDLYFEELESEIEDYKEDNRKIVNWSVSKTSEIVYETVGNRDFAYVDASYFLTGNQTFGFAYQTYMLRKGTDGKWKILAFYQTEGKNADDAKED